MSIVTEDGIVVPYVDRVGPVIQRGETWGFSVCMVGSSSTPEDIYSKTMDDADKKRKALIDSITDHWCRIQRPSSGGTGPR